MSLYGRGRIEDDEREVLVFGREDGLRSLLLESVAAAEVPLVLLGGGGGGGVGCLAAIERMVCHT